MILDDKVIEIDGKCVFESAQKIRCSSPLFLLPLPRMRYVLQWMFLLGLGACSAPPDTTTKTQHNRDMTALPQIISVTADGKILLADSTTQAIPHYGEDGYLVLYLVRHCEKDPTNYDDPVLTPEGQARAERLGRIMDNAVLDKVTSTNTKRTIETALAVKRWAGDPVMETFPPMAMHDWLMETLENGDKKRIFHVGHQHTVPILLNELTNTIDFKNIPDEVFNRFYIAITSGIGKTQVLEFQY